MSKTEAARLAVEDAKTAWNAAPIHIRTAAGKWAGPIVAALDAIAAALEDKTDGK